MARELSIDTIDIFPFGYIDIDGQNTGIIYEISNIIAKTAGFTAVNKIRPYSRTIIDLKNGDADIVIRYPNAALQENAISVATIIGFNSIVIGNVGSDFKSIKDLHGKTIGSIRGGVFDSKVSEDKAIIKYEVKDYEQIFKMLLAKKLDAVIGSTIGLYLNAKKMNISKAQLGKPLILEKKYFTLFLSKKNADPQTILALKKAVKDLVASGEISKIIKKYDLKN